MRHTQSNDLLRSKKRTNGVLHRPILRGRAAPAGASTRSNLSRSLAFGWHRSKLEPMVLVWARLGFVGDARARFGTRHKGLHEGAPGQLDKAVGDGSDGNDAQALRHINEESDVR